VRLGRRLVASGPQQDPASQARSDQILVTTLIASALPPLLKKVFDQERPDRRTVSGHWRDIPFSGKRLDAFPSGHALHIGALASAASLLPAKQRNAAWAVGLGLVLTRIVLLAHWTSDVTVGLGVGAPTERFSQIVHGLRPPGPFLAPAGRYRDVIDASGRAHDVWFAGTEGGGTAVAH
jgi:hypothetical protein